MRLRTRLSTSSRKLRLSAATHRSGSSLQLSLVSTPTPAMSCTNMVSATPGCEAAVSAEKTPSHSTLLALSLASTAPICCSARRSVMSSALLLLTLPPRCTLASSPGPPAA
jgi:hypothetical protein